LIAKLLSLISTGKGAAAAAVLAAATVGGGVAATNSEVRDAVGSTVENVTTSVADTVSGQPPVVTARNAADRKLRQAFQDDQKKLERLRSSKVEGADREKLGDIVKTADEKLRARLTTALDATAALTLGREGHEASGSPKPSGSAKPSTSPDVKTTFTPDAQTKIDAIVAAAITDMDKIVTDATAAVGALPTFILGKPSDHPSGKPGEKPSEHPGGKPSDVPGGKPADAGPSAKPTR
jgi:hypothetical protein